MINCIVTLVLLNCFNCIFNHLKLELLTQFPASIDEKYRYWYIGIIALFTVYTATFCLLCLKGI